jgi:iron complex outermembrane receptor protein/outer membrane receptor for ferrienterochelin and colicins
MILRIQLTLLILFFSFTGFSQENSTYIRITDRITGDPIPFATIFLHDHSGYSADSLGILKLKERGNVPAVISALGYETDSLLLMLIVNDTIRIKLMPFLGIVDSNVVVVSLRSNQRIEYAPVKVEVLGREELEEESLIKPSGIASLIGDVSGVQIQQSSAVSGDVNVRIQGLEGRYTQVLRDGVPLYDGFSGGFGILSIPPLDLRQIELIKGSASTLYGGGAIGGLINLISKDPGFKTEAITTINQSTLSETNLNTYVSRRNRFAGFTAYAGLTRQQARDVDGDGLSDVARNRSVVFHPRFFLYPSKQTKLTFGYSLTSSDITGGDIKVIAGYTDSIHRFIEKSAYIRHTGEFSVEQKLGRNNNNRLVLKSSLSTFTKHIGGSEELFNALQVDHYHEMHLAHTSKNTNGVSWVAGLNFNARNFKILPNSEPVQLTDLHQNTIGVFGLCDFNFNKHSVLEAGLRFDKHSQYGDFVLPHLAFTSKLGKFFGLRLGIGAGYKTPDALAPQWFQPAVREISPIDKTVVAERSWGYNAEFNYKKKWDKEHDLFINQAFYYTQINHPVSAFTTGNGGLFFSNDLRPVISKGFDTYIRFHSDDVELYAGITYTIAERTELPAESGHIPYTPKFRAAFTAVKEWNEQFRLGLEGSYNGKQYRITQLTTPGYFFMAAMISYSINKHIQVVLNGENLLDIRQSKMESINNGTLSNPLFQPLWAPIDGRVINCCIKWSL